METIGAGAHLERYHATAVVLPSNLREHPHPDPYYHVYPQHERDRIDLERRLQRKPYQPWLQEYHLKAEISEDTWYKRTIVQKVRLGNGRDYEHVTFQPDIIVDITDGIAFLDFARTYKALRAEATWVVVDFFSDDVYGSNAKRAAERIPQIAARSMLTATINSKELPHYGWLNSTHAKAIRLVCETTDLVNALKPLVNLDCPWPLMPMSIFENMRKVWCTEEIANYLRCLTHQLNELTLHGHAEVKPFIDPESLKMLQSTAPVLSSKESAKISRLFKARVLFPGLTNEALRKEVEMVVYRQGPILSLGTLATDLSLLRDRIHKPLSNVIGEMKRKSETTVQRSIKDYLEAQFKLLWATTSPLPYLDSQGEILASRCYEELFIRLMRTKTDRPITFTELDNLARREYEGLSHDTCDVHQMDVEDKFKEIKVDKRHGTMLFKDAATVRTLHRGCIRAPYYRSSFLSASSMRRYITCVFLYGVPPIANVIDSSIGLDALSSCYTIHNFHQLPLYQSLSHNDWNAGSLYVSSATCPHASSEPPLRLQASPQHLPSIVSRSISPTSCKALVVDNGSSSSSPNNKRGQVVGWEGTPNQRRRISPSGTYSDPCSSPTLSRRSSSSQRRYGRVFSVESPPLLRRSIRSHASLTLSPPGSSDYSRSRSSTMSATTMSGISQPQIADLLQECAKAARSNPYDGTSLSPQTGCQDDSAVQSPEGSRPAEIAMDAIPQRLLLFQLAKDSAQKYATPRTKDNLQKFIDNQKKRDKNTTFRFTIPNGNKILGPLPDPGIEAACLLCWSEVILVDSDRLASSDPAGNSEY